MSYTPKEYLAHQDRVAKAWQAERRLLALVPELLEALRELWQQAQHVPGKWGRLSEAVTRARVVIAKAEDPS